MKKINKTEGVILLMRKYYPNYSIGTDAYADIPMVCEKYGTKAVIIGGTHALASVRVGQFNCCS